MRPGQKWQLADRFFAADNEFALCENKTDFQVRTG